jgi:hypothetical protein
MVFGTTHNAEALADDLFVQAQQAGSTDALRRAKLGDLFGFTCLKSQNVPNSSISSTKARTLAFHKDAIAYASRPLADVTGPGAVSSVMSLPEEGLAARMTYYYDGPKATHVVRFDSLWGVQTLDAGKGVYIETK